MTFYNPNNRMALEAATLARQAGQQFGVQLIERHATSVEELRQRLEALKAREVDAYFYTTDGMVTSHAQLVIDMATSKKLPTMFSEQSVVAMGGLASYGQNFYEIRSPYSEVCAESHDRCPSTRSAGRDGRSGSS